MAERYPVLHAIKSSFIVILYCCMLMIWVAPAQAQPCSGSTMQYTVYVKVEGGVNEAVTVIRDALREDTWYYAASKPRIAMDGGVPVFSLTRYQSRDPKNPQKAVEGAVLQFAVRLDPSEAALAGLKSEVVKVAKGLDLPTEIRLSPLPYKRVRMWTFTPGGGFMAEGAPDQKEFTTGFATAEIPFTLSLSNVGADVFADLCERQTGIPIWVEYTYASISPPCGFSVTVDWAATFKHVSKVSNSTTSVGFAGCGLAFQVDRTKIRETLTQNKCITVKTIDVANQSGNMIDRYLDPILKMIYDELFDTSQSKITSVNPVAARQANASPKDSLAAALAPLKPSSGLIQFNTSFVMKTEDKVRKDKQEIDMTRRRFEESRGGCGGFIGVGDYLLKNPTMKDKLITLTQAGDWPNATFFLPKMLGVREFGVTKVTLSLAIFDEAGQVRGDGTQQTVKWIADGSDDEWFSQPGNQKRFQLLFPMASLYDRYSERLHVLKYRVEAKMTIKSRTGTRTIKNTRLVPLANGDVPLSTPLSFFEVWRVNAESIDFAGNDLSFINATLIDDSGRQTVQIKADSIDKRPAFLIPACDPGKGRPVKINIQFALKGKTYDSGMNTLGDVRELGPEIFLFPEWETATGTIHE